MALALGGALWVPPAIEMWAPRRSVIREILEKSGTAMATETPRHRDFDEKIRTAIKG
jgi:hypothetical protein